MVVLKPLKQMIAKELDKGGILLFFEMTYQIRVNDIKIGANWYQTFLKKAPDFIPHDGFVEWEVVPGCWLQVAEGTTSSGSGPLRLAVKDIEAEKSRFM